MLSKEHATSRLRRFLMYFNLLVHTYLVNCVYEKSLYVHNSSARTCMPCFGSHIQQSNCRPHDEFTSISASMAAAPSQGVQAFKKRGLSQSRKQMLELKSQSHQTKPK